MTDRADELEQLVDAFAITRDDALTEPCFETVGKNHVARAALLDYVRGLQRELEAARRERDIWCSDYMAVRELLSARDLTDAIDAARSADGGEGV